MKRINQRGTKSQGCNFKRTKREERDRYQRYLSTKDSLQCQRHEINREILDITMSLPSAVLAKILFDGYLDTSTIINILSSRLCHFITNLAAYSVFSLDLRRCLKMKPSDVRNICYRFPKLKVRCCICVLFTSIWFLRSFSSLSH